MNQTELNKARIAEYNKAHVNDSAFSIGDEWDESKHPRAANGQFGSGGATSAPTKASKAPVKGNGTPVAKKPAQAKSTFSIPKTEAHESVFGGADGAKWEKMYKGYYKDCQKFDAQATPEELDKTITNSKAKLDHLVKGLSGRTPDKVSKMEKQMYAGTLAEYHSALAAKKSKE